mmetsp:Transcript_16742/g.36517  ORF Transcript_16742/g.36517 Transcript_16742/m.36517 type:complete len:201 (-) Transcript_16742:723-1325(-)
MKEESGRILGLNLGDEILLLQLIPPLPLPVVVVRCCRPPRLCGPFERQVDAIDGDSPVAVREAFRGFCLGGKFQKAVGRRWHVGRVPDLGHTVFCKGVQDLGRPGGLQFSRHVLVESVQKEGRYARIVRGFQGNDVAVVVASSFLVVWIPEARIRSIVGISFHSKVGHGGCFRIAVVVPVVVVRVDAASTTTPGKRTRQQ